METNKVNKTSKIEAPVINKHQFVEANQKGKVKKNYFALKLFFKIFILVLLLVFLARVPYVGSYPDGLIDYLFGQAKYAFYLLGIFVMISLIYNGRIAKIIKTPKFIIFSILILISIGCIISGTNDLIKFFKTHPTFVERMNDYHSSWKSYFLSNSYSNYFNNFISGGILAVLLSFLFNFVSYAVLIVFAIILLIISLFVIFNINYKSTKIGLKLRGWLVRKLGGSFKYDGYDELKNNDSNQNKFRKTTRAEIELSATKDEIDFELLPKTDINNDNKNWKQAANIQTRLVNLFKQEKINCVPSDINAYTTYSEICFETKTNADVKEIIKLQPQISKVSHLDKFNLSYRGNILTIEFDNPYFSKLSFRSVAKIADHKKLNSFFGIDKNKKLMKQEFKLSPSALIVGKKGSGSAMLAVLMSLSMCLVTKPSDLDLVILSPNCEQTFNSFVDLPHTSNKIYENVSNVTNKLHDLQTIVNQRASLLKINNVTNIDQYNKLTNDSTSQMKHILIVISNFENAIKETFQNSKIIEELLANGPQVGVYTILQSYSVNSEALEPGIYNNISDKYFFAVETAEESNKIFDNARASVLHPNGDCIHFVKDKVKAMERIQVCNINKEEVASIIDIIKTFYDCKKEQSETVLLEGNNNEKVI